MFLTFVLSRGKFVIFRGHNKRIAAMSFERFDIRDRETGEWIHDLTREMLAQYVLGKLPGYDKGTNFRKYEPLRDEVHHTICCGNGTMYYDGEMVIPRKRK